MSMERGVSVGVDLGGTKMLTALVDEDGKVLREDRQPTGANRGADDLVHSIVEAARRLTGGRPSSACAVGVGVAAQVDHRGTVRFSPNLRLKELPLREELEAALGLPVRVLNDVRAATVGEWRFGVGRGESDLVCLFIGTGLGGGVVSGGRLLVGRSNAAGELGHLTVVAGGRPCTCPNRGCLEAYVGGWAIAARAREAAGDHPDEAARFARAAGVPLESADAHVVLEQARRGDPFAERVVAETRSFLSAGLVGIANAFNPRLIVAGGGVVSGGDLFESALVDARPRMLPSIAEPLRGARAALGDAAVAIGAATWARGEGA